MSQRVFRYSVKSMSRLSFKLCKIHVAKRNKMCTLNLHFEGSIEGVYVNSERNVLNLVNSFLPIKERHFERKYL